MVTSKFIWESFEKYSDEIFYINGTISITYEQFYEKVKEEAKKNTLSENKQFESLLIDSSLESLVMFFALTYNSIVPILLAKQTPENQIKSLLESIQPTELSDEDATIMFTSGSSSIPKAILHTFGNHYYSALGSSENLCFQKQDRLLLSLPLHHIGGLSVVFRTLLAGGTMVGYDNSINIEDSIRDHKVTHVSVVPTQLRRMMPYPEKLKSLKAILVGGSFVSDDLITIALELKLPIYKTYGMSEMSSQVTTTSHNASQPELQTSGKVLKHRELKIADDSEILVRGEVLSKRYLNSDMHLDSEGWFHTGDIGSLDKDRNLTVHGRKDNMFISGGENIYPEPIEKIVLHMKNVVEVCIVPKKSDEFGEISILFYKTENGSEITLNELREYLSEKVMNFEIPKEIYQFPKEYKSLGIKLNRAFLIKWLKNL